MPKRIAFRLMIVVLLGFFIVGSLASASTPATPGSAQDPLITESYLQQQLELERQAREGIEARLVVVERRLQVSSGQEVTSGASDASALAALGERVSALEQRLGLQGAMQAVGATWPEDIEMRLQRLEELLASPDAPIAVVQPVQEPLALEVISLRAGEAVLAEAGTEIILRSGSLTVIATGAGGIADLTAGRDLGDGEAISANHHLLVPRDDGRGVVTDSGAIFLLRGKIHYR